MQCQFIPVLCSVSALVVKTAFRCGGRSLFRTSIMPPDCNSPQDAFNINMVDPQLLDAPDGLTTALRAIEAVCYRGDPEIAEMVLALNSRPHILEYIISGTPRVPTGLFTLPTLIVLLSSAGGGSLRGALKVDGCGVSHIKNVKHAGYHECAAPPAVLVFVAVRGLSICCRCIPQPPRVLQKGGTLVQRS